MTDEELIKLAHELQFAYYYETGEIVALNKLRAFADRVAEHEREACAKVCDEREEVFQKYYTKGLPTLCAQAIRARGNT